jgi:NTE family protein
MEKRKKIALVLSGGGAKGAFQLAVEKYAREVLKYEWDIISGISIGAINGAFFAMQKYDEIEKIWKDADIDFRKQSRLYSLLRILFSKRSIYNNSKLKKILDKNWNFEEVKCDLRVGIVSLFTGEYKIAKSDDDFLKKDFKNAIRASAAIPIAFEPVCINGVDYADGGLRNISPLSDVLNSEPDEVIIINCNLSRKLLSYNKIENIFNVGLRSLEIVFDEILYSDVSEFLRINEFVKQAEKFGVTLRKSDGKPYKYFKACLIEPPFNLGDTLDFSKESIAKRMEIGWETAKIIFDRYKSEN